MTSTSVEPSTQQVVDQQAQHASTISAVLTKVTKIQKECKYRRYKDLSEDFKTTLAGLAVFKDAEWPPKDLVAPDWMSSPSPGNHVDERTTSSSSPSLSIENQMEVDKKIAYATFVKKEIVSPPIIKTVELLGKVLTHPSKSSKMCELALDSCCILLKDGYISGQAGNRRAGTNLSVETVTDTISKEISTEGDKHTSLLQHLINCVTKCADNSSEVVQTCVVKTILGIMMSNKCGVHEATMLTCVRSVFHVYLVTKSQPTKAVAKTTLLDMLKCVFNRMEAYDAMSISTDNKVKTGNDESAFSDFASQFHTDGYLLFRALCKLSAKTLPGEESDLSKEPSKMFLSFSSATVDPLALNSKILSLEMILGIFEHCGNAFRNGEKFIYAVQHYLCVSLLKNCMSTHTNVAHLSLKVFLVLVYNFKAHLKAEIEVFVANIFLKVLESPNSSYDQKVLVLETLKALSSDPHLLTQIFLNYDCDLDSENLYKKIIGNLTRLIGNIITTKFSSGKAASQEIQLSNTGLEVLVVILSSFLKALDLPIGDGDTDDFEKYSGLNKEEQKRRTKLQLDMEFGKAVKMKIHEESEVPGTPSTIPDDNSATNSVEKDIAAQVANAFDRKQMKQQNFEIGSVKFRLSLKEGINFFVSENFVELDAKSLAHFFLNHKDSLDKTQIGEALGKEPEYKFVKTEEDSEKGGEGFFVRVLHHYVEAFEFGELQLDEAIRLFLGGFRLPGEAQKIDRFMEKFAECYTRQNEGVFDSADTAFVVAFAIIMLNTDLHNPNIKPEKKMTKEKFINLQRGICVDGSSLPDELLGGIFDRIQSNAFTLKEDDVARAKLLPSESSLDLNFLDPFSSNTEDRKRDLFKKEKEEMMAASEKLFRKKPRNSSQRNTVKETTQKMESIQPSEIIKPMFDVTWAPLIAILSQVLELTSNETSISLSLQGFMYAIRLASHSHMSLARDTFVCSLAKFTTLGSLKEMKQKHIQAIRILLTISILDGDSLADSWGPVLQCISQLGRLQQAGSGLRRDDEFLNAKDNDSVSTVSTTMSNMTFFRPPVEKQDIAQVRDENNGRAILAAINDTLIDKVFSSTVKLSANGIINFVQQLVMVSAGEIAGDSSTRITGISSRSMETQKSDASLSTHGTSIRDGPRIFSLQKLVEVADYNMDVRPRLTWTKMWEMMASHLSSIGCHKNAMVSMFAIDALRQLSFKFLEKSELSDFNFQRLFLRPFLEIMENPNSREDIRELILRCVDNMIRLTSHNLRSGWKIFLEILGLTAADPCEKICTLGLGILQRLLDEHLHELCRPDEESISVHEEEELNMTEKRLRNAKAEDFASLCRASLAFVHMYPTKRALPIGLSMRALCHIACFSDLIAEGRVLPPVCKTQSENPGAMGYTYESLTDQTEREEMSLWRPIFDGLASGLSSGVKSNSGGVGCLVQRGSIMAIRAILLRHGHIFSPTQWKCILSDVLGPSIEKALAEDQSPIVQIVSESPTVSALSFMPSALPLPPPHDDDDLRKFAKLAHSEESAPVRPFGPAELLVEASFADLRYGGDGDLKKVHVLDAKKSNSTQISQINEKKEEQPFPDSWIATAGPIALGTLTDILSEISGDLWPLTRDIYYNWIFGSPSKKTCEALVRIGCKELCRVLTKTPIVQDFSEVMLKNILLIDCVHEDLITNKFQALGYQKKTENVNETEKTPTELSMITETSFVKEENTVTVDTPFGAGKLESSSIVTFSENCMDESNNNDEDNGSSEDVGDADIVTIYKIPLEWGATLYTCSDFPSIKQENNGNVSSSLQSSVRDLYSDSSSDNKENYLERCIPALKIRSVAAYELQNGIPLLQNLNQSDYSALLETLEKSRVLSHQLYVNQDLAHAFQEARRSEWGDCVLEVEKALAAMSDDKRNNRGGSELFFLAQEASANKAIIKILSSLLFSSDENWDGAADYAEPILTKLMLNVLEKFLESEKREGHLVDPSVWRSSGVKNEKIALYCSSFAGVVVTILQIVNKIDGNERILKEIFPYLCELVRVRSDEIRDVVADILSHQVSSLLGLVCTNEAS